MKIKITSCSVLSILTVMILSVPAGISARKKGYKLKNISENRQTEAVSTIETRPDTAAQEMVAGSFMVASQCPTCNSGYALDQIVFTGFDKNQYNAKESFFIINKTDRELTGVSLYIEYITPDRRQLHKRFLKLTCSIPAGETRKADIQSWDTQKSFYYYKSNPSKRKGNPFDVKFDIIAYYLRAD
ncbi:MAG: hypothetical protein HFJ90_09825 [Muribaculaceae bacterium]|jgi:hypothetical protein|nr:hypothetical protein [Muribaculaceae bacterium]MCI9030484.1 hypothetical protein [Muribaculaceae bacterium]